MYTRGRCHANLPITCSTSDAGFILGLHGNCGDSRGGGIRVHSSTIIDKVGGQISYSVP